MADSNPSTGPTATGNTSTAQSSENSTDQQKEDALLKSGDQSVREMKAAMATMMDASTQMMQAFIDMRMSYLKVMRAGLDDPETAVRIATENMRDLAGALKDGQRKK